MRPIFRTSLWISALALSSLAAADGYSIKRRPTVGVQVKYSLSMTFDVSGGGGTLKATLLEKVTAVDKDGSYTVEQTQLAAQGTYDKEDIDVPQRAPIDLIYKPNGQVSLIKGDVIDMNSYRMENLGAILDPGKQVEIGDVWIGTIKEDKTLFAPLATPVVKTEFKLLAAEKVDGIDTLKISAEAKEAGVDPPPTNYFTVWISVADGSIVKLDSRWVDAPFPGASSPVAATIKLVRIAS